MDAITLLKGDHAYVQRLFKFMVLAKDVRHHVKEEEGELLRKLRQAFAKLEVAELGEPPGSLLAAAATAAGHGTQRR